MQVCLAPCRDRSQGGRIAARIDDDRQTPNLFCYSYVGARLSERDQRERFLARLPVNVERAGDTISVLIAQNARRRDHDLSPLPLTPKGRDIC